MQFTGNLNKNTVAIIINVKKYLYGGCSSAVKEPLFNFHNVIHDYIILARLTSKTLLKQMYNFLHVLCGIQFCVLSYKCYANIAN